MDDDQTRSSPVSGPLGNQTKVWGVGGGGRGIKLSHIMYQVKYDTDWSASIVRPTSTVDTPFVE